MTQMTDMTNNQPHWTDEQFSGYVLGLTQDGKAGEHLDRCAQCREELERFRSSVASFSSMSLEWSERRSSTLSAQPIARPVPVWLPTAAWAMAAAVAIGLGLPSAIHRRDTGTATVASTQTAQPTQIASVESENSDENSPAAIARDNQLMMAVAAELNRTDPMPYTAPSAGRQKRRGQARED
jgi:hypothetical protein